jgi:nicotinamide-nucleotide amidase
MDLLIDFDALLLELGPLAEQLRAKGWRMATAESCTGGLIAALCTSVAGSSDWFDRGFVTYSNAAKTEQLGVPAELIETQGAVSGAVAAAMAEGALRHSAAQWAVAVTGIAGPGGATPGKPVGSVWLACAGQWPGASATLSVQGVRLPGDRTAVRSSTVRLALAMLAEATRRP